jgi:polyhydroxybutyrate depolymerase
MVFQQANAGRIALAGLFFTMLLGSCNPKSPAGLGSCPVGTSDAEIVSGGVTRDYRLFVPPAYRPEKAFPLVLGFHGHGGSAGQFESYSGFSTLASQAGFIAVYPQGAGQIPSWDTWAGSQDVQFIRDLIATVEAQCAVDRNQIYAVGHSRGGGMANRLACDLSDRIAAVGSVSGTYLYGEDCSPGRPVAIVAFHGSDDPDVPYNGIGNAGAMPGAYFSIGTPIPQWAAAWADRNECDARPAAIFQKGTVTGQGWKNCRGGSDVILYTINGGEHEWPGAVDAAGMIWTFFSNHPLSSEG